MDATASGAQRDRRAGFPVSASDGARTNDAANRSCQNSPDRTRAGKTFGMTVADGEVVWSWRPGAGVKSCGDASGPTGFGWIVNPKATVANKPVTGESPK
jgi:hypothetical protein